METAMAVDPKEELDRLRVVEHAVHDVMSQAVPIVRYVLAHASLEPKDFDGLCRVEKLCVNLLGRVTCLTELWAQGEEEKPNLAAYRLEPFFTLAVREIAAMLGSRLEGDIRFQLDPGPETAVFDPRRVSMILYHLVANAVQHGRTRNKDVKIRCRVGEDGLELRVQDYGGGMAQAEMERERFPIPAESLPEMGRLRFPGYLSGLGIPLCRKLAWDMGGQVTWRKYYTGTLATLVIPQTTGVLHESRIERPDRSLMALCMAPLLLPVTGNPHTQSFWEAKIE